MSTDTPSGETEGDVGGPSVQEQIDELKAELADLRSETVNDPKRMTIIATKGTLDMAYPPLILASTASAFGWDVTVFHTFWGLDILHKDKTDDLKLSAVGNPNMPVPNVVAALPGMDAMATKMMQKKIADNDTATIGELIDTCLQTGVELQACQMTQELMGYDEDDFFEGVTTGVGAATAIDDMADADIQLMI